MQTSIEGRGVNASTASGDDGRGRQATKTAVIGILTSRESAPPTVAQLSKEVSIHNGASAQAEEAVEELIDEGRLRQVGKAVVFNVPSAPPIVTTRDRDVRLAAIAKTLAHPLRIRIITAMATGEPASAARLTERFGDVIIGTCSYHVRKLALAGVLVLIEERQARGAVEHRYVLLSGFWDELCGFVAELNEVHPLARSPKRGEDDQCADGEC